jgi:hypothetical protein
MPVRTSVVASLLPLLIGVLGVGCGSSSPVQVDVSPDRTLYQTGRMELTGLEFSSGLTSGPRFFIRVDGSCQGGASCKPQVYRLRVNVSSPSPIEMSSNRLSLTADGETFVWPSSTSPQPGQTFRVENTVTTVKISRDRLETLARASSVTGTIGGRSFTLSDQAPLTALLRRSSEPTARSSSSPKR